MQRIKVPFIKVKEVKPLFWKRCTFCGKEYRNEKMFQLNAFTVRKYVCHYCINSKEEVEERLLKAYKELDKDGGVPFFVKWFE